MSDDTSITVRRTIDASTADLFNLLTDPHQHVAMDGSGRVRSVDHGDRITGTGQQFRMNMSGEQQGEYQTDNHVNAYDPNKMVGWQTAPAGQEPPGWEWLWELHAEGSDATDVTLTYDWSKVTDPELLKQVHFPMISEAELEESLSHLAEAVAG